MTSLKKGDFVMRIAEYGGGVPFDKGLGPFKILEIVEAGLNSTVRLDIPGYKNSAYDLDKFELPNHVLSEKKISGDKFFLIDPVKKIIICSSNDEEEIHDYINDIKVNNVDNLQLLLVASQASFTLKKVWEKKSFNPIENTLPVIE